MSNKMTKVTVKRSKDGTGIYRRSFKRYSELNLSHGLSTETETYKNFINANKDISESLISKKNTKESQIPQQQELSQNGSQ